MVIDIPIEVVENSRDKQTGEVSRRIKLAPGFWRVRINDADTAALGNGGHILVSNPLIEVLAVGGWGDVPAGEDLYINLVTLPASNPGDNSDGPSITENLATIV